MLCRLGLLICFMLPAGPATARSPSPQPGGPTLTTQSAPRARAAHRALQVALVALSQAPSASQLRAAQQAMAQIDAALDQYFHASNLTAAEARPWALALRPTVHQILRGPDAVVHLVGDVFYFRASVHDRLAGAAQTLSRLRLALEHRRLANRSAPSPGRQAALQAASIRAAAAQRQTPGMQRPPPR